MGESFWEVPFLDPLGGLGGKCWCARVEVQRSLEAGSLLYKQLLGHIWGFPKIRGSFLGVPIIRVIIFGDLNWSTPIWGNYHIWLRNTVTKQDIRNTLKPKRLNSQTRHTNPES